MPEAYRLNDYVLHGIGDPKALLKGMYFWTWDTEEVLDMIEWMREFNASGKGILQFTGFDMQTPDVALQNVEEFLSHADPAYASEASYVYGEVRKTRSSNFGVASGELPVSAIAGRRVRFSGYIRRDGIRRGYAGLWLRVDGPGGTPFLDNMSSRGPRGTTQWRQYDITVDVPRDAARVYFGMLQPGDGTAWFDSLAVAADGRSWRDDSRFDFGFESAGVRGFSTAGKGYAISLDRSISHFGRQSLRSNYVGISGDQIFDMCSLVVNHMTLSRDTYISSGYSEWDVDWAIQNAQIVAQAMDQARGSANRDPDMARNIGWILDHNPNAKVVLWAHNLHVAAGGVPNWAPMGSFLRDRYGADMVVFGFAFNRGGLQAVDAINGGLKPFEAPVVAEGSFEAALAATGIPYLALDLRSAPPEGPAAWFRESHPMRNIGSLYAPV